MKNAQKPDHVSLNTLVHRLKEGRFVIPDFQREFEWKPWDIQSLMRSIFLDYYIGSLLLWKGKKENFDSLSCENIHGYEGPQNREYIVLDGQQRLTAIYYAFLAPDLPLHSRSKKCYYFIRVNKFMNLEHDEAFSYEWDSRRWNNIINDRTQQYVEHIFPLSVIGQGGWALPNWVQEYEQYWKEKAENSTDNENDYNLAISHCKNAHDFGEHLKEITEQYQISYIELDQDLEIAKICDIFTQINNKGITLDIFDLMNALLKPKDLQLKHMWRDASSKLKFVKTEKMNVYILQVMSILKQAYCSPKYLYYILPAQEKTVRATDGTNRKEVLIEDIDEFESLWNDAVSALEYAIKLISHPQEFGVVSSEYLPYISILPAFASLEAHLKTLPANKQLDAQRKIRHWYWAAVFTKRYSGSVESTSARDFLDVKSWIEDDSLEPPLILEFKTRFKNIDFKKEVKKGSSIYNGIFNLLVLQGARDWMTGNIPQHGDLDDHHIVPSSWGTKHFKDNRIHTILNRTPLTQDTNRKIINDRLPNEYLPELISMNGEKTVRSILESHFISPKSQEILMRNPFSTDDFEAFIAERQRTIQEAIENLLIKERLDLSPALRELDEKIEQIELRLRDLIAESLSGLSNDIPRHIQDKVDDRILKSAKKNPAMDEQLYESLNGKLEFFDLRDLQDTITATNLWDKFKHVFDNKESLNHKFTQLTDLRNLIRHSRSVDEITKKEGEASIMWFENTLN